MRGKERGQEIQRLFHEAILLPARDRQAFLEEASRSDPDLSSEVEDLLRADLEAECFLGEEVPRSTKTAELSADGGREPPSGDGPGAAGAPEVGEVIGDYEILEKIGGNMGLIFKARHRLLDRVVALKLLPAEWAADSERRVRFERELRVMGQLQHPNLVAASDARVEGPWHLVAMELIEGLDLERLVWKRGPLPVAAACEAASQAALGLEHLHQRGLIHRDIKPSNLMLAAGGTVKVIDVGLALLKVEPEMRLTRTGVTMGTVGYCAPEQFRDSSRVDIPADIYSLGCTLFHLLAGRPPYGEKASVAEEIQAHLSEPFPALLQVRPDAPPALEKVLARMTAKDRSGRFATAAEVASALRPFSEGADLGSLLADAGKPRAGPGSPVRPCPTREGRGRRKALLLLTVAALVLTLGLFRAAQQWSLGLGSGQVGVLEVESLDVDVDHHSGQAVLRGRIGAQSFGAEVDDDVQISVALSEPAYCYLLALNPDGQVQLCWPEDEGRPPPRVKALLYPTGGQVFGLTDGEGLQGFLVAAAREPLPAYGQWRARLSALPWTRTQAEGVWCFDEGRLLRVSSQGSQESGKDSRTRGQVRNLRGIQPFSMICETLRSRPEFNSVRAIAFPVKGGN